MPGEWRLVNTPTGVCVIGPGAVTWRGVGEGPVPSRSDEHAGSLGKTAPVTAGGHGALPYASGPASLPPES